MCVSRMIQLSSHAGSVGKDPKLPVAGSASVYDIAGGRIVLVWEAAGSQSLAFSLRILCRASSNSRRFVSCVCFFESHLPTLKSFMMRRKDS